MELVLASLASFGVRPRRFPFRCSGNLLMTSHLGIMVATLCLFPLTLAPPLLHRLFPEYHFESPPLWLTMHADLRRNARIRVVWDWLAREMPALMAATRAPVDAP